MRRKEGLYEVLLDLRKDYGALDQERCTEILVEYVFGPWVERLLQRYLYGLTLVVRVGRYCGSLFKDSRRVIEGYSLYLTISNIVVDVVILHWEAVVFREDAGPEGFGREVKNMYALFCVNDGLIVSPQPVRLQEALDALAGISERVNLRTNMENMVGMV